MVVCRVLETATSINQLRNTETMQITKNLKTMEITGKSRKRLTASERRFVEEIQVLLRMSLSELMVVERTRMAVGI